MSQTIKAAILFLFALSVASLAQDPGDPDSLFISCDTVIVGEQAIIQVSVINDEEVEGVVIPISYDTTDFYYLGCQFYGDVLYWDDISVVHRPDSAMATILGWANMSGGPNPRLNTHGAKEVIAELYFSTNPSAAPGTYPFDITIDPALGPLLFWDSTATIWWTPVYENGCMHLTLPPSCDLSFVYLWAYGPCNSPWIDRQYASMIGNYGSLPAQDVVLTITIPSIFIYKSSNPPANENNGTMVWNIGTLNPGQSFHVDWFVDIPGGIPDSTVVVTVGDITTITYDLDPVNNHSEFKETVGFSYDPNDKEVVPVGVTEDHYVTGEEYFQYTIYFENEGSSEALNVEITDALDNNLDWASFLHIDSLMSHPDPCTVYINQGSGIITFDCDGISLQPGEEGHFVFTVDPRWDISTGTSIQNEAYIQFDFNDPMVAPQDGPVFHTIDKTMPLSNVGMLPDTILQTSFDISWTSDDGQGSGVAFHDIYVSDNGGPFTLWLENVTDTTGLFTGQPGHEYAFYSIATDYVSISETPPPQPDAIVYLKPSGTYVVGDVNGDDVYNGMDITYGVAYFKGGSDPFCGGLVCPPHPSFWVCGDVNGSCSYNGLDITYGVEYLKMNPNFPELIPCGDCPPAD
ncbi:MAG: DUF11 domain-containing protein [Candidatus Zixiibacteriota bacterium]|nr:MAG: DUF11 domain-containing protein [candidate division Zixibacteria bacterium]